VQTNERAKLDYIVNGDTSAASVVGPWVRVSNLNSSAFAVTCTGTPTGTFSGECTNVEEPNVGTIPTATQIVPADSPATFAAKQPAAAAVSSNFDFNPAPTCKWMRFKYVRSAGGAANALQVSWFGRGV
jgi:hypothetical protein